MDRVHFGKQMDGSTSTQEFLGCNQTNKHLFLIKAILFDNFSLGKQSVKKYLLLDQIWLYYSHLELPFLGKI